MESLNRTTGSIFISELSIPEDYSLETYQDDQDKDKEVEHLKPINEIFICFGQEEYFEGDLTKDASNFDILDLFGEEHCDQLSQHHLEATLKKRQLERVLSRRQYTLPLRPNCTIKQPDRKPKAEVEGVSNFPSLTEFSVEIMDGIAQRIHEQSIQHSARQIIQEITFDHRQETQRTKFLDHSLKEDYVEVEEDEQLKYCDKESNAQTEDDIGVVYAAEARLQSGRTTDQQFLLPISLENVKQLPCESNMPETTSTMRGVFHAKIETQSQVSGFADSSAMDYYPNTRLSQLQPDSKPMTAICSSKNTVTVANTRENLACQTPQTPYEAAMHLPKTKVTIDQANRTQFSQDTGSNEAMSIQQMTSHNFKPVRKNSKVPQGSFKLDETAGVNQYIRHLSRQTQEELQKPTRLVDKKLKKTSAFSDASTDKRQFKGDVKLSAINNNQNTEAKVLVAAKQHQKIKLKSQGVHKKATGQALQALIRKKRLENLTQRVGESTDLESPIIKVSNKQPMRNSKLAKSSTNMRRIDKPQLECDFKIRSIGKKKNSSLSRQSQLHQAAKSVAEYNDTDLQKLSVTQKQLKQLVQLRNSTKLPIRAQTQAFEVPVSIESRAQLQDMVAAMKQSLYHNKLRKKSQTKVDRPSTQIQVSALIPIKSRKNQLDSLKQSKQTQKVSRNMQLEMKDTGSTNNSFLFNSKVFERSRQSKQSLTMNNRGMHLPTTQNSMSLAKELTASDCKCQTKKDSNISQRPDMNIQKVIQRQKQRSVPRRPQLLETYSQPKPKSPLPAPVIQLSPSSSSSSEGLFVHENLMTKGQRNLARQLTQDQVIHSTQLNRSRTIVQAFQQEEILQNSQVQDPMNRTIRSSNKKYTDQYSDKKARRDTSQIRILD